MSRLAAPAEDPRVRNELVSFRRIAACRPGLARWAFLTCLPKIHQALVIDPPMTNCFTLDDVGGSLTLDRYDAGSGPVEIWLRKVSKINDEHNEDVPGEPG